MEKIKRKKYFVLLSNPEIKTLLFASTISALVNGQNINVDFIDE